jgi:hypothetical protein
MLTNFDLEKIAKNYDVKLIGIYSKNELDNLQIENGNYIINLDDDIGSHWTALNINKNKGIYFDSFGCMPPQNVISFVKQKPNIKFGYNNFIIQDLESEKCGFYCIAFLLFLNRSKNKDIYKATNDFIELFKDNTLENDEILKKYLLKNLNTNSNKIKKLIKLLY